MKNFTIVFALLLSSFFSPVHAKEAIQKTNKRDVSFQCSSLSPSKIFKTCTRLFFFDYKGTAQSVLVLKPLVSCQRQFNSYFNFGILSGRLANIYYNDRNNKIPSYISNIEYAINTLYTFNKNLIGCAKVGTNLQSKFQRKNFISVFSRNKNLPTLPFLSTGVKYLFKKHINFNINYDLRQYINRLKLKHARSLFDGIGAGFSFFLTDNKSASLNGSEKNVESILPRKYVDIYHTINIQHPFLFFLNISQDFVSIHDSLNLLNKKIEKSGKERIILVITGYENLSTTSDEDKQRSLNRALEASKYFIKKGLLKKNIFIQGFKRSS
ncbi:hypothetical protein [Buchnera aphidicola]|uniref:hypothetical protein n=1 Tax=Buchnera aphidicola TaxID=9 RepID=UPI0012ACC936|nr:hypothetical protein [Buchnera aphidicola]